MEEEFIDEEYVDEGQEESEVLNRASTNAIEYETVQIDEQTEASHQIQPQELMEIHSPDEPQLTKRKPKRKDSELDDLSRVVYCIQQNPCIWDLSHKDHSNHLKRAKVFEQIANELKLSGVLT